MDLTDVSHGLSKQAGERGVRNIGSLAERCEFVDFLYGTLLFLRAQTVENGIQPRDIVQQPSCRGRKPAPGQLVNRIADIIQNDTFDSCGCTTEELR